MESRDRPISVAPVIDSERRLIGIISIHEVFSKKDCRCVKYKVIASVGEEELRSLQKKRSKRSRCS